MYYEERQREEIAILEERLSGLPLEQQRVYMAGYLDSVRFTLECGDPEDENSDHVPRIGFRGAGFHILMAGEIITEYLIGKLEDLAMGEEAAALKKEYESTKPVRGLVGQLSQWTREGANLKAE